MSLIPTLDEVVKSCNGRARYLIQDSDVTTEGTVRVKTTHGAHLTRTVFMETVRVEDRRRELAALFAQERADAGRERAEDAERMRILAPIRRHNRGLLASTRLVR